MDAVFGRSLADSEPVRGLKSLSLGQLHQLAIEARYAHISEFGQNDLIAALEGLRAEGAPIPMNLGTDRLAWAVAFNVAGLSAPAGTIGDACQSMGGYHDRWPPNTPWTTIWSTLVKQRSQAGPGVHNLLSELALSVACEERDDWQHPAAEPLNLDDCNRAFEFVYERNRRKVVGDVFGTIGTRAGAPEAIADEAWSRVFCDYWSTKARRRFLGLCRISTLVCQVARYTAYDAMRKEEGSKAGRNHGEGDLRRRLEELGFCPDPGEQIAAEQLESRIRQCMASLPARQKIVATMVWLREIHAKRVAEILHISEPAVSQHVKKAREAMRTCLKTR